MSKFKPPPKTSSEDRQRESSHENRPPPPPLQLHEDAFHGPLGEITLFIKPHTEADPSAILFQLIVGFGSAVGRNPFFLVEKTTKHHTNLYLVLNGQSSKARKGTSWNHIVDLLLKADPLFGSQLVSGLSTG
jgi:hypothetical protein